VKTASAIGERQMLPVQTKQTLKSADSSKMRSKLIGPLSRRFPSSTAVESAGNRTDRPRRPHGTAGGPSMDA